jgi:hypothetical protein
VEDLTRTALVLAAVYILLGLVCMIIVEFSFSLTQQRARMLKRAIRRFVGEGETADRFLRHPLTESYGESFNYISPGIFSAVLVDYLRHPQYAFERIDLRDGIEAMPKSSFKYALQALAETTDPSSVEGFANKIESWFQDVMNQLTGFYKMRAFCALLPVAVLVCAAPDADTLSMANALWARDAGVQSSVSAPAAKSAQPEGASNQPLIGWGSFLEEVQKSKHPSALISLKIFGIFFTALVVTLASMLLFDGLNGFTNVRFTGPRPGRERKTRAKIDVSSDG